MLHRAPILLAVLLLLLPAALLHADEDPVPGPRPLPEDERPTEALDKPGQKPGLTLLEAGAEPREALRYKIKEGTKDRVEMRLAIKSDLLEQIGMALPAFVGKVDAECTRVAESGTMSLSMTFVTFTIEDADSSPMGAMMGPAMAEMEGTKSALEITPRGEVKAMQVPGMGALGRLGGTGGTGLVNPNQTVVTLPEEPVGVGAKWRVVMKDLDAQGMKTNTTIVYTLKAREGSTITIQAKLQMSAPEQEIENPQAAGMGVTTTLTSMQATGTIDMTADLTRCSPTKMKAGLRMVMEMEVSGLPGGAGETMPMSQTLTMDIESTAKPLSK